MKINYLVKRIYENLLAELERSDLDLWAERLDIKNPKTADYDKISIAIRNVRISLNTLIKVQ